MAWLEWLRRPGKEKLGNLYLELCPDNRIKSFMVTRHRPQGADSFMTFIDYTAGKAIKEGNRAVPDNLLLAFYGVPERLLPRQRNCWRNNRRRLAGTCSNAAG